MSSLKPSLLRVERPESAERAQVLVSRRKHGTKNALSVTWTISKRDPVKDRSSDVNLGLQTGRKKQTEMFVL